MHMNFRRYRIKINNLILNSFPKLKNTYIWLFRFDFKMSYAAAMWPLPFFRIILLNKKCEKLDDAACTGLLAHELCHHDLSVSLGWVRYILTKPFIYIFSAKDIIREENATDKLTIEKGYGRELYALTEILERDKEHQSLNKFYLTKEQIKRYAESLNKW